jgi:hypothetical protein
MLLNMEIRLKNSNKIGKNKDDADCQRETYHVFWCCFHGEKKIQKIFISL